MEKDIELHWWNCMPFDLKWYRIVENKTIFPSYPNVDVNSITNEQIKIMYDKHGYIEDRSY